MNTLLLQQVLVGVLVAGCALYSAWRLASRHVRLRALTLLGALPGMGRAAWLARARARTELAGGCGGCAPLPTRDAASRNQTPDGLRR